MAETGKSGMNDGDFIARWRRDHRERRRCCTMERAPFFDMAARHLPGETGAVVVDIGAGDGAFLDRCARVDRALDLRPLDANADTIGILADRFPRAARYQAPESLPFANGDVSFVHCSHIVEHLDAGGLHALLGEIDRVLRPGGVLVVSAPLMRPGFWDDLSHVRPYTPEVFRHYLCGGAWQRLGTPVSERYEVLDLAYRWTTAPVAHWGSPLLPIDALVQGMRLLFHRLGLRRYRRNGFTLVLRKG